MFNIINPFNRIPYGDKILEMAKGEKQKKPGISRNQQMARLKTGKRLAQAVKAGEVNASLAEAAQKMEYNAKKNLAELNFSKRKQNHLDQIAKAAPLLDHIIPGSGQMVKCLSKINKISNVAQHINESPSTIARVNKIAGAIFNFNLLPLLASTITLDLIATTAAAGINQLLAAGIEQLILE